MKIVAYRIAKRRYGNTIWSGAGAKEHGGRWNSKGVSIVYTSESRSLAALEQLVHVLPPRLLSGFVISSIEFDDAQVERVDVKKLPARWKSRVPPAALRRIGDEWIAHGKTVVLAVPSAVVQGEWNYLINPAHAEFASLAKSPPAPFIFDSRLS